MTYTTPEYAPGVDFQYLETSIPAGVTISDYRRARPRRPTRWERLKRVAGSTRSTAQAGDTG
jgi:hypothetical protein